MSKISLKFPRGQWVKQNKVPPISVYIVWRILCIGGIRDVRSSLAGSDFIITMTSNGHQDISNSPASCLFVQQFVQDDTKGTIKALCHCPIVKGTLWSLLDSPHKGPVIRKLFSCHYMLMIAKWVITKPPSTGPHHGHCSRIIIVLFHNIFPRSASSPNTVN